MPELENQYDWVPFYKAVADKLLEYKSRDGRLKLAKMMAKIAEDVKCGEDLFSIRKHWRENKDENEPYTLIEDVSPYTIFFFMAWSTGKNYVTKKRVEIIKKIGEVLEISNDIKRPNTEEDFYGIPSTNKLSKDQSRWDCVSLCKDDEWFNEEFHEYKDKIWEQYELAIKYADGDLSVKATLINLTNQILKIKNVGDGLMRGMFQIRPNVYLTIDSNTRDYLKNKYNIAISKDLDANKYFELLDTVKSKLSEVGNEDKLFLDISHHAYVSGKQEDDSIEEVDNVKMIPANATIWKISHGIQQIRILDKYKDLFRKQKVVVVNGLTNAIGKSPNTQGDDFQNTIKKGDYFYLCYGNKIQLLGRFTSDEAFPNEELKDNWYERPYQIIKEAISVDPYSGAQKWWTPNFNSTCIKVDDLPLFESAILKPYFGMSIENTDASNSNLAKYTKDEFLSEVYMDKSNYDKLVRLIEKKKNVILQGPPGVGKTYAAKKLAYSMMGEEDDERVKMIQFHQSYSYEDFIMGIRPSDEAGKFVIQTGVFYDFCDKAKKDPNNKYFFIIDEINRGNLSKIFGELFLLIESDKRNEVYGVQLLYSKNEKFWIPPNLYIIGLMNTADRSLAMLDYALRRRFAFFEMKPGFDTDGFKKYREGFNSEKFNNLIKNVVKLNKAIAEDDSLGEGFCIGHSFFCNLENSDNLNNELANIVEFEIIPLLKEYWFDETDKCNKMIENLIMINDPNIEKTLNESHT